VLASRIESAFIIESPITYHKLCQVGGTVGDIESMVFLEALRQMQFIVSAENLLFIHVSLVPVVGSVGEQKTKPTQHSVKELRSLGISPDVVVCRSSTLLDDSTKAKLSSFCHVPAANVLSVHDVSNIYHVPLILVDQGLHTIIRSHLALSSTMSSTPAFSLWREMATTVDTLDNKALTSKVVSIAIVGKYTGLSDSYLSVLKSLKHSSIHLRVGLEVVWVEASHLEEHMNQARPGAETEVDAAAAGNLSEEDLVRASNHQKYLAAWEALRNAGAYSPMLTGRPYWTIYSYVGLTCQMGFLSLEVSVDEEWRGRLLLRLMHARIRSHTWGCA
jgi:CTP synthase (UTP-ammonia lyase)